MLDKNPSCWQLLVKDRPFRGIIHQLLALTSSSLRASAHHDGLGSWWMGEAKVMDQGTKQDKPRGEGRQPRTEREAKKGGTTNQDQQGHPSTTRSATEPGRQRDAPTGALHTKRSQEPNRATHQGNYKTTNGAKGSKTIFVQSVVRLTLV